MKRLIAAGILLAAIITLCVTSNVIIKHSFTDIRERITECESYYGNGDAGKALEVAKDIEEKWHKTENILSMITNHGRIDEIRICISRMRAYVEAESYPGFLSEITELKTLIEQLEEDEKITMHSVF